jgi:hypothetical protein
MSYIRGDCWWTDTNNWTSINSKENEWLFDLYFVRIRSRMKNIVVMPLKLLLMSQVRQIMILLKDIKLYGIHFLISMSVILLIIEWNQWFRFKNGTPEVQSTCIKHLKSYFVNHPELRADLEGEILIFIFIWIWIFDY